MASCLSGYLPELLNARQREPLLADKELCLATIYRRTGARPLWVTIDGPNFQAKAILDRLRNSLREGLSPQDYDVDLLLSLWGSRQIDDLVRLDTRLTYSLVKYIHDISHGPLQLRQLDPDLFAEAENERFDPFLALERARSSEDIGRYLDSLAPQHDAYKKLKKALADYRTLVEKNNWPVIGDGALIRPGMNDSRLQDVRRRLELTGDGVSSSGPTDVYDEQLVAAVKTFQRKYGLEPDGIIGTKTRSAFNLTPTELMHVIRANMMRMHMQAHDLGDTYIMVNIAGFMVKAVRNGKIALEMPAIVGKLEHQTPVFSDKISYLDFNPYWHVPPSIAKDEELPALRMNPHHLVEQHIRLFANRLDGAIELDSTKIDWRTVSRTQMSRYQLRQDPGPWNALGRVKFVFPNHHSVYMHDTPAQDLFQHASRSFSHGCIRVSRPLALAEFVLNGQDGWDREAIERVAAEGKRKVISLRRPIPIHITYQTAWVDITGSIRFNSDIYGRDARLLQIFATGK